MADVVGQRVKQEPAGGRQQGGGVRNNMEYRDRNELAPSPEPSLMAQLIEDLKDPGSPNHYDDDRIQNDLLDEICCDIGIKDSMELDFFDLEHNFGEHIGQDQPFQNNSFVDYSDSDNTDYTISFSQQGETDNQKRQALENKKAAAALAAGFSAGNQFQQQQTSLPCRTFAQSSSQATVATSSMASMATTSMSPSFASSQMKGFRAPQPMNQQPQPQPQPQQQQNNNCFAPPQTGFVPISKGSAHSNHSVNSMHYKPTPLGTSTANATPMGSPTKPTKTPSMSQTHGPEASSVHIKREAMDGMQTRPGSSTAQSEAESPSDHGYFSCPSVASGYSSKTPSSLLSSHYGSTDSLNTQKSFPSTISSASQRQLDITIIENKTLVDIKPTMLTPPITTTAASAVSAATTPTTLSIQSSIVESKKPQYLSSKDGVNAGPAGALSSLARFVKDHDPAKEELAALNANISDMQKSCEGQFQNVAVMNVANRESMNSPIMQAGSPSFSVAPGMIHPSRPNSLDSNPNASPFHQPGSPYGQPGSPLNQDYANSKQQHLQKILPRTTSMKDNSPYARSSPSGQMGGSRYDMPGKVLMRQFSGSPQVQSPMADQCEFSEQMQQTFNSPQPQSQQPQQQQPTPMSFPQPSQNQNFQSPHSFGMGAQHETQGPGSFQAISEDNLKANPSPFSNRYPNQQQNQQQQIQPQQSQQQQGWNQPQMAQGQVNQMGQCHMAQNQMGQGQMTPNQMGQGQMASQGQMAQNQMAQGQFGQPQSMDQSNSGFMQMPNRTDCAMSYKNQSMTNMNNVNMNKNHWGGVNETQQMEVYPGQGMSPMQQGGGGGPMPSSKGINPAFRPGQVTPQTQSPYQMQSPNPQARFNTPTQMSQQSPFNTPGHQQMAQPSPFNSSAHQQMAQPSPFNSSGHQPMGQPSPFNSSNQQQMAQPSPFNSSQQHVQAQPSPFGTPSQQQVVHPSPFGTPQQHQIQAQPSPFGTPNQQPQPQPLAQQPPQGFNQDMNGAIPMQQPQQQQQQPQQQPQFAMNSQGGQFRHPSEAMMQTPNQNQNPMMQQQQRMGMAHQGSTSPSGGLFNNVIMEPQPGKMGFIQQLVSDKSNAFRSHPLFPLLRDLIIADMNLNSATFPFQLIANLPSDFDKLLQNYLQRNPPSGQYQSNHALESVIMDALKYAHRSIIDKIRQRKDQQKMNHMVKPMSTVEDFCDKFDETLRKTGPKVNIQPARFNFIPPAPPGQYPMCKISPNSGETSGTSTAVLPGTPISPVSLASSCRSSPSDQLFMNDYHHHPHGTPHKMAHFIRPDHPLAFKIRSLPELSDNMSDTSSTMSTHSGTSTRSEGGGGKNKVLPKEAVAVMLDWLKLHQDKPYPNDDEKEMLIKKTGLSINQINYWFVNARRRILPKWNAAAQAAAQAAAAANNNNNNNNNNNDNKTTKQEQSKTTTNITTTTSTTVVASKT